MAGRPTPVATACAEEERGRGGPVNGFNSLAVHVPELHESVVVAVNENVRGSVIEAIAIAALCG